MSETMKWCSIWGNAMSIGAPNPETYSKDISLRYEIACPMDGEKIRITFDNFTGKEPIHITKACIHKENTFVDVTFDGKKDVVLDPQKERVSDEIFFKVKRGDTFKVSFYLKDYTSMRSAVYVHGPLSKGSYALGDQIEKEHFDKDTSKDIEVFYFLSDVSLFGSKENHCILCYGDSITAQDWPDYLNLRIQDLGYKHTSVIRKAMSGSRILREYSCLMYESYGLKGTKRFLHEVKRSGVDTIILQQGINDIIHPVGVDVNPFRPISDLPSIEELIEGFSYYIEESKKLGLKVYVGTLPPIKGWRTYADFRNVLRVEFNNFLRTTDLVDGCIDFDEALRDPNDLLMLLKEYDSGDHLHPSSKGYQKMASIIPENLFR